MRGEIAYLVKGRSLSDFTDAKVVGYKMPKKKSRKEIIHEEIKRKQEKEEKIYKTKEDLEQKLPKKRIPVSYLLKHGDKIELEYALEYYKNEFPLLKFNATGEILDSGIKLKNRYEVWTLMLPFHIYKNIIFLKTKLTCITGEDILEKIEEYPKYSEIIKKYITK
ncbi:hypothetical protein AYK26_02830 [Euryarchaeota archaeon SM23-78]|nr:MAG: hypothetical protein AYK26_02830 [Euryarchaeota archaeon SM23-78]MBW3001313.1 hypothetical protein [Candidatus Woesearchaeota archaeon]